MMSQNCSKENLDLKKDGVVWLLDPIERELQKVYDHFRAIVNENAQLKEENERLKSEHYKDEELLKMKAKLYEMSTFYYKGFPITEEEEKRIWEWMKQIEKGSNSTIGGRFYYEFVPTSIGVAGTIIDSVTGKRFTFQELN